jgi:protein-tyrosine-phosphatase
MPTVTIEARAKVNQSDSIVELELSHNDRQVNMTARRDWTIERLAQEIVTQEFPEEPDRTFEKALTITFHTEEVIDPETGETVTVRVVDSVEVEPL